MNWTNRLTNYNFWISIVSAVLLILQAFEFHFDIMYINEIATAVLGLLVVIGIINDPTKTSTKKENTKESISVKPTENIEENKTEIKQESVNQIADESVENVTKEQAIEEQNFPIDEQDEIDDEFDKNDIKNLINNISTDVEEESVLKEMFKNLFEMLKNDEKTVKNDEIFENSLKIDEEKIVSTIETELKENKEEVQNVDNLTAEKEQECTEETNSQPEENLSSFNIVN